MSLLECAGCSTRYASGLEHCPHCGSAERVAETAGAMLPALTVICRTDGCVARGQSRQVVLRQVALGVLHVPQVLRCAHCFYVLEGESLLPKITRHGGPTNAAHPPPEHVLVGEPGPEPDLPFTDAERGDQPSPGNSSSTSAEKPESSPEPSSPLLPKRAPRTASRSKRGRAESSTALSTDGPGPETPGEDVD